MGALFTKVVTLLVSNAALFEALINAIEAGADKDSLLKLIEASMVTASDAAMKAELTK